MLFFANLSNTDVAAIATLSSMITAVVVASINWLATHQKNEVDESATLFDAYNDVVNNLQKEIQRLQSELQGIRSEMQRCENSNKQLSNEIKDLRRCIDRLSVDTEKIETIISAEYPPSAPE